MSMISLRAGSAHYTILEDNTRAFIVVLRCGGEVCLSYLSDDVLELRGLYDPVSKTVEKLLCLSVGVIVAVRFYGMDPAGRRRRCCKKKSKEVDERYVHTFTYKDIARFTNPVRRSVQFTEQDTGSIGIYFICRYTGDVWRLMRVILEVDSGTFGSAEVCPVPKQQLCIINASELSRVIRSRMPTRGRPKRLLIFINPFGGKRRGIKIYEKYASPLFKLCNIHTTVVVTKRANHARDFVVSSDLSSFDGIVVTGGDGLFNEVLNGLVLRTQREANIDINDRNAILQKPTIPIGVIPAGSTNALAHTIHGTDDVLTSILHIIMGDRIGVDVCGVYNGDRLLRFASTAVSYGFLGDVLKESERMRRMGPARYIFSGLKVWLRNADYAGHLRCRIKPGFDVNSNNLKLTPCRSHCAQCLENDPVDESACPTGDNEVTITDRFTHIVGIVIPCLCKLAPRGIGPNCHLGDGYMQLVLVSRVDRMQNLAFFGKIMSKNKDHMRSDNLRLLVVKEFSFTPQSSSGFVKHEAETALDNDQGVKRDKEESTSENQPAGCDKKLGTWNVDGELVAQPDSATYFRVHRQLITLFARGIEGFVSSD